MEMKQLLTLGYPSASEHGNIWWTIFIEYRRCISWEKREHENSNNIKMISAFSILRREIQVKKNVIIYSENVWKMYLNSLILLLLLRKKRNIGWLMSISLSVLEFMKFNRNIHIGFWVNNKTPKIIGEKFNEKSTTRKHVIIWIVTVGQMFIIGFSENVIICSFSTRGNFPNWLDEIKLNVVSYCFGRLRLKCFVQISWFYS